jgi:HEAT repeat protein
MLAAALALAAPSASSTSSAHILPGAATLSQLTRAADVVAVAKITDPKATVEVGDPKVERPIVIAAIVEVLRGDIAKGQVRFVPHGHGAEAYTAGEEVLVFLQKIERNRDLAGTKLVSVVRWAGIDEVGDRITLRPGSREALVDAARAYAEVAASPEGEVRGRALRRATVRLLGSSEPRIASSALRDVVLAGSTPLLTAEDLPQLERLLGDPGRALSLRVGLLGELERRRLIDAASAGERWARLLRDATPAEVTTIARGVGTRARPEVTPELVRWMEGDDAQAAAAAASALGVPGNEAAVDALAKAAWGSTTTLRWTALQSLGRIASPAARAALDRAAREHPDAEARRAAQTELNLLAAKEGRPAQGLNNAADAPATSAGATLPVEPPSIVRSHWKALALLSAAAIAGLIGVLRARREARDTPKP